MEGIQGGWKILLLVGRMMTIKSPHKRKVKGNGGNKEERGDSEIKKQRNQLPMGLRRSAVPLPCFFHIAKSQRVAGQRP